MKLIANIKTTTKGHDNLATWHSNHPLKIWTWTRNWVWKNVPIEWDFIHNMKELKTWNEVNVEDYVEKSYLKVLCLDWKQCNALLLFTCICLGLGQGSFHITFHKANCLENFFEWFLLCTLWCAKTHKLINAISTNVLWFMMSYVTSFPLLKTNNMKNEVLKAIWSGISKTSPRALARYRSCSYIFVTLLMNKVMSLAIWEHGITILFCGFDTFVTHPFNLWSVFIFLGILCILQDINKETL
jgi:hypothetical protein